MPQISVIVPVYNVGDYLQRCIESILNQTFIDFELIIVDDGSVEDSGIKCDEFMQIDSRIKVIHRCNGGVASARNLGLNVVLGQYVYFCDSDDYLEFDCLMSLYTEALLQDSDCLVMDYYTQNGDIEKIFNHSLDNVVFNSVKDRVDYIEEYVLKSKVGWALWMKLFRTSIIKNNKIKMCETCENYGEDFSFFLAFLLFSKNISFLNYAGYHYNVFREGSITIKAEQNINLNALNEVSLFFHSYLMTINKKISGSRNYCKTHFLLLYHQLIRLYSLDLKTLSEECKRIEQRYRYNMLAIRFICKRNGKELVGYVDNVFEIKNLYFYSVHLNYKLYCLIDILHNKIFSDIKKFLKFIFLI